MYELTIEEIIYIRMMLEHMHFANPELYSTSHIYEPLAAKLDKQIFEEKGLDHRQFYKICNRLDQTKKLDK